MKETTYKGLAAWTLENEAMQVTLLPGYAWKIASLISKKTGREFLFQSAADTLRVPDYGAAFSDYDSSGFDEVFPSIDACPYPDGSWAGMPIPDHGEVWAMHWEGICAPTDTAAKAFVRSQTLPYIFSKSISIKGNELLLEYCVENTAPEDFKFIWTPHCLLACSTATRLLIPENLTQVMTVEHGTKHLGPWGTLHSYPLTKDVNGQEMDLAATEPASAGNCEKFYFTDKNLAGWCGIEHTDTGERLIYSYDPEKVPYLGVWKTQGGYRGDYNIALEPCTGVYDDLYVANKIRRAAVVGPKGRYEWSFKMTLQ